MQKAMQFTYALLRIGAGVFFMCHGGQKFLGWFGGFGPTGGVAPLMSQLGLAGVIELIGGAAIALGLFTQPVAFIASGEMAVAYFTAHFPNGFWPIQNHGEPAALNSLIFLFFAAHGAGSFSLDSLMKRER